MQRCLSRKIRAEAMERGADSTYSKKHLVFEQLLSILITKRPHNCDVCKLRFIKKEDLDNHMRVHARRLYRCDHCKKTYQSSSAFQEHFSSLHINGMNNEPHTCPM